MLSEHTRIACELASEIFICERGVFILVID